ncbi:MAG: hypothetical protein KF754_00545 [Planctomycetes bacterium]|nr:hypothetical protein [Planctomycetota bacterium]
MSAFESLVCPHCGADLDVPEGVSILKCRFCGSKLQLKETGSVRALALIERGLAAIGDNTARTADGVERLHEQVARQRAESHAKWQAKLRALQNVEAEARRRRVTLGRWMFFFIVLWILASIVGLWSLTSPSMNEGAGADSKNTWATVWLIQLFALPVVAGVISALKSGASQREDQAEEEVKLWMHREPL